MGVDLHGYDTNDLQVKYSHNILTCNHKAEIDFHYGSIPVCSVDKLRVLRHHYNVQSSLN